MWKLSFGQNQDIAWSSDSSLWGNQVLKKVLDRTKVLHGPRTQTYEETNYLKKKLSFGQNQGIAWSSDSNLWGNQLLINIYQVLDRTKVLHGPRTQTNGETNYLDKKNWVFDRTKVLPGPRTQIYGETNYLDEKTEFWTEPRYCMVLGLKPIGKPTT